MIIIIITIIIITIIIIIVIIINLAVVLFFIGTPSCDNNSIAKNVQSQGHIGLFAQWRSLLNDDSQRGRQRHKDHRKFQGIGLHRCQHLPLAFRLCATWGWGLPWRTSRRNELIAPQIYSLCPSPPSCR